MYTYLTYLTVCDFCMVIKFAKYFWKEHAIYQTCEVETPVVEVRYSETSLLSACVCVSRCHYITEVNWKRLSSRAEGWFYRWNQMIT